MPKFKYVAKDQNAAVVNGVLEAEDEASVVRELKKRSLAVIEVSMDKGALPAAAVSKGGGRRVSSMDLVVFSRQLATLIDSGVSLITGLNILRDQIENPYLKQIILEMKSDIETGHSLSGSFVKYPHVFPTIFANMIRAGETSGSLNEILERIAEYMENSEALRRKIKSSLTYPAIVVIMAIVVVTFLVLKVVPTFKSVFSSMGGTLPLPTQILIAVSNIGLHFFPVIIAAIAGIFFGARWYINTEKGRINFDDYSLKIPVFGPIVKKVAIAKFTRTLSTLVRSGVSILEAFEIAGRVCGNKVIEQATNEIRAQVRAGESIAEPMEKTGKFPQFVSKMIAIGEQTGELEKMLNKISDYYEGQVNDSLAELTSMIEPMVIAFLGVTVGSIVIAMFLPMFKITQLVGN